MTRKHIQEAKVKSKGGATSSALTAYDQLPYHAMKRLADRYGLGEFKHGRHNWRKSLTDRRYVLSRLGHVIHHALKAIAVIEGFVPDDGDDNAGAIMWGGAFLAESQEAMKSHGKKRPTIPTAGRQGSKRSKSVRPKLKDK